MKIYNLIFKFSLTLIVPLLNISCEETLDESVNIPKSIVVDATSNTSPIVGWEINDELNTCQRRIFERNNFRKGDTFTLIDKSEDVLKREWRFRAVQGANTGEVIPHIQFSNNGELSDVIEDTIYPDSEQLSFLIPDPTPDDDENNNQIIVIIARLSVEYTNNHIEFRDIRLVIYGSRRYLMTESQCKTEEANLNS